MSGLENERMSGLEDERRVGKGFDRLAGVYDLLVRLVFGRAIEKAQCALLEKLPPGGKILLIGGGTGWLLKPLCTQAKPAELLYLDASAAMIAKARAFARREIPQELEKITFLHGTQLDLTEQKMFDILITPFFLDLFSQKELPAVFEKLKQQLQPDGCWYLIDFQLPANAFRPFARALIWVMYRFFRLFTSMSGNKLCDPSSLFRDANFQLTHEKSFYLGMVKSQLWERMRG